MPLFQRSLRAVGHMGFNADTGPEPLMRRQPDDAPRGAALGGGNGKPTSNTKLPSISGYDPPNTSTPKPGKLSSGKVMKPSDIPGYDEARALIEGAGAHNSAPMPLLAGLAALITGGALLL